jgi:FkbM family methyltransferase
MTHFMRNAVTALSRPGMALEYVGWLAQRSLSRDGAVRKVCGVKVGNFNSFSEYHSLVRGVSGAELAFLRGYPFGTGAILDVGANLGLFSLVLARRFTERRVVAFEPAPSTFAALMANVKLNAADNVECRQAAVAEQDGLARFAVREDARANSSLVTVSADPLNETDQRSIEIPCISLDRFVPDAGIDAIALLKVDVEGFEAAVFRGAHDVLLRTRPKVIYFEVCPVLAGRQGFEPGEAAALLEGHGYSLRRIAAGGALEPVTSSQAEAVSLENWVGLARDA